jgi:hypothetical protein
MKKDILLNGASPMKLQQGFSACKKQNKNLRSRKKTHQLIENFRQVTGFTSPPSGDLGGYLNHPLYIK